MADIKRLQEFENAIRNNFLSVNPDIRDRYYQFFGLRIDRVFNDDLNEDEYIKEWEHPTKVDFGRVQPLCGLCGSVLTLDTAADEDETTIAIARCPRCGQLP